MPGWMRVSVSATIRSQSSARRSAAISGPMPGRRTFTATRSPVLNRAWYTQASDADPIGSGSKASNTSSSGRPRLRSMIAMACSVGNGRRLVEHLAQLGAIGIGQHVGAHRQLLSELGEGRAGVLEHVAQPNGAALDAGATHQPVGEITEVEAQKGPQPEKQPADRAEHPGREGHRTRRALGRVTDGAAFERVRHRPARHRRQSRRNASRDGAAVARRSAHCQRQCAGAKVHLQFAAQTVDASGSACRIHDSLRRIQMRALLPA